MQFATSRNRVAEIRRIADASRERNGDRLAHANDEARSWKMAFWVSTALLTGAVGALGYVALQPRFVPYTVAVDQHGVALPIAPAARTVRGDPNALLRNPTFFQAFSGFRPESSGANLVNPNAGGTYLDPDSESLYQESLQHDRRSRRLLIGGEAALLGAAALFVWEFARPRGRPENIPFEPTVSYRNGVTRLGMRVDW